MRLAGRTFLCLFIPLMALLCGGFWGRTSDRLTVRTDSTRFYATTRLRWPVCSHATSVRAKEI